MKESDKGVMNKRSLSTAPPLNPPPGLSLAAPSPPVETLVRRARERPDRGELDVRRVVLGLPRAVADNDVMQNGMRAAQSTAVDYLPSAAAVAALTRRCPGHVDVSVPQ